MCLDWGLNGEQINIMIGRGGEKLPLLWIPQEHVAAVKFPADDPVTSKLVVVTDEATDFPAARAEAAIATIL